MSVSDQELLKTMHEIGSLLFLKFKGDLSEEQQIDLDQWMIRQDATKRQFFEECTEYEHVYSALQMMYEFDQDKALAEVQKKNSSRRHPTRHAIRRAQGTHTTQVSPGA